MLEEPFKIGSQLDRTSEDNSSESDQADQSSDKNSSASDQTDQLTEQSSSQADDSAINSEQSPSQSDKPPITDRSPGRADQSLGADDTEKPKRSSSERTYTFRATAEIDEILQEIIDKKQCGKGEAVLVLIDHLMNQPPEVVEREKVIERPVEVVKEVTRPRLPGEHFVVLDEKQQQIVAEIQAKRSAKAKEKGLEMNETIPEILVKALFIRGRLFNYDNEFYTGLTKSDVQ